MIFDSHFHIDIEVGSDRWGVKPSTAGCLISRDPRENHRCVEVARDFGFSCAVFVSSDSAEVRDLMLSANVSAYKHVELNAGSAPDQDVLIFETASHCQTPIVLHFNHHDSRMVSSGTVAKYLAYAVERFPGLPVVVAHLGAENCSTAIRFATTSPNIYLNVSCLKETSIKLGLGSSRDVLKLLRDSIPSDQILFGSDLAHLGDRRQCAEYRAMCGVFGNDDQSKVLWQNGARLFRRQGPAQLN